MPALAASVSAAGFPEDSIHLIRFARKLGNGEMSVAIPNGGFRTRTAKR